MEGGRKERKGLIGRGGSERGHVVEGSAGAAAESSSGEPGRQRTRKNS